MPSKSTDGFTKSANQQKFIRNRDIKLKDSEVAKEERTQRLMCEGVCDRCREKVQWRFQYDKYKSLKAPGKCAWCMNKTVTKAYRAVCDPCASAKKACGACMENIAEANALRRLHAEKVAAEKLAEETGSGNGEIAPVDEADKMLVATDSAIAEPENPSLPPSAAATPSNVFLSFAAPSAAHYDESKFLSIRDTKYNKDRAVGGGVEEA